METWRPIAEFDGAYEVSDQGRVRGVDRYVVGRDGRRRFIAGRILRQILSGNGKYLTVSLKRDAQQCGRYVHRLVAEAFIEPCPDGMECCHNDGNGFDNRVQNLRWDTHAENVRDVSRHGRHSNGSKTHCKRGHEFTEENTYVWTSGSGASSRICRTCQRLRAAKAARPLRSPPHVRPRARPRQRRRVQRRQSAR